MSILGIKKVELINKGAIHTAREINQQPDLWKTIGEFVDVHSPAFSPFFDNALEESQKIILTGAGTSAFIGLSLRNAFASKRNVEIEAISTTDIVSHPNHYFSSDQTILLVSFARSGNSPESIATVELADKICKKCFHLIITCSSEGKLAHYESIHPAYVFKLPKQANDQSLAMTSSYSGMLLAAILLSNLDEQANNQKQLELLCSYGEKSLQEHAPLIQKIAETPFKRAVFLGSGPLYGVATEGHLKLQELTDGEIICKTDSFLGFRHGPKAVVNEETLVFYLLSNIAYVQQYELDLIQNMDTGQPPMIEMAISESSISGFRSPYSLSFTSNGLSLDEKFLAVCSVIPAQLLGFYKSLNLGFSPDAPSKSGAINRVVEGVNIYPFK